MVYASIGWVQTESMIEIAFIPLVNVRLEPRKQPLRRRG
jgi:hypothetical protein